MISENKNVVDNVENPFRPAQHDICPTLQQYLIKFPSCEEFSITFSQIYF